MWGEKRLGNDEMARNHRRHDCRNHRCDRQYSPRGVISDRIDVSKTPLEYCKTMFNFDFEIVAL